MTSDHELKQFLVVRNFNPRASVAFGVTSRVSLWLSVARCFAADSSSVTHSRNRFYVLAFLVVRDLRLRFELHNSQPQFVFRFCDFLDVNLQDFVWKFFAEERFLIPENGTYRPRPRCGGTPKFRWPPHLRTRAVPIGTIKNAGKVFLRGCYTMPSKLLLLPNCPPIRSYLSHLI